MPKMIRLQTSPSSNGQQRHLLANGMPAPGGKVPLKQAISAAAFRPISAFSAPVSQCGEFDVPIGIAASS
jgi:hypothetical protein